MNDLNPIQQRHIGLMQKTGQILENILRTVSQATATTYRDGPDGWTTLEVLCHLCDFDGYFRHRAEMMVAENNPALPAYDHEQIAIDQGYNQQQLSQVLAEFSQSRRETVAFFQGLSANDWQRTGIHPERDSFSMTDAVMQVGHHDIDHIEQITRILQAIWKG